MRHNCAQQRASRVFLLIAQQPGRVSAPHLEDDERNVRLTSRAIRADASTFHGARMLLRRTEGWKTYFPRPKPKPSAMASTRLSNPQIVTANTDPKPSNVVATPANGSDGTYTWACVGQKDTGSTSTITFSVTGTASSPVIANGTTNLINAACQVKAATTNFVQVTASYVAPSNSTNWTIVVSGIGTNNNVRFVRGTGGGTAPKRKVKAAVVRVAKPAAKKATKKAAKKVVKKAAKKAVKKTVKKAAPANARKKTAAKRRK
jgi:hypothetical protein